jgi:hypothetical protein
VRESRRTYARRGDRTPSERLIMRTLWKSLGRVVLWSYERGTWPYDIAVVVIVLFVLLSPRSWFRDRPPLGPAPGMVQLTGSDSDGGTETYRVDARVLSQSPTAQSQLEHDLHEAMRNSVQALHDTNSFEIVRIEPIRGDDGAVAYYDVSIRP